MDDFREWLSDNLRYFMLGFGILAVVLILFFGVRFISSKFGNQKTECLSAGQCTDRKILCSTDRQRRAEFKRTGG